MEMNKEVMNIHQGLIELKTLDKRIEAKIHTLKPCIANRASNTKVDGIDISDFSENAKNDYVSVNDLIKRRTAIKRAITLSNAITYVNINDIQYSIAEAIEMKNHGIELKVLLCDKLNSHYFKAINICNEQNLEIENKANNYVQEMFSNKDGKSTTSSLINEQKALYIKQGTYEIVDPIGIKNEIDTLLEEIDSFKNKVDSTLSVSNAITTIEISY